MNLPQFHIQTGGTIWGDCGTFRRWGLAGVSKSLACALWVLTWASLCFLLCTLMRTMCQNKSFKLFQDLVSVEKKIQITLYKSKYTLATGTCNGVLCSVYLDRNSHRDVCERLFMISKMSRQISFSTK